MNSKIIDLQQIISIIRKYLVMIALYTVLGAAAGFLISSFLITPVYRATADMIVNNKNAREEQAIMSSSDITASNYLTETYSIILKSHEMLESIIGDKALPYTYSELSSNININSVNDTQILRIKVDDTDKERAIDILQTLVDRAPDMIVEKAEVGSVKVVDSPWISNKPVEPNVFRYTFIGIMIAVFVCVVVILAKELMTNTFKSENDLTAMFAEPILGTIPYVGEGEKEHERK